MWRVEHLDEVDSTNTWLGVRARAGAVEGLVVFADFQTAGRGRRDRQWASAPGSSLLCSILLRPPLGADQLQLAVAAVALAIRAALVRLCGLRPQLKWPNDLVVGRAKLAGLLAEMVATDDGWAVVVGCGINLSARPDLTAATCVLEAAGVNLSARALLDIVLEELEGRREHLESDGGRTLLRAEYDGALVTRGQLVRVETPDHYYVGVAEGVDANGQLVVEVDGVSMTFSAGDVVHLRMPVGDAP